MLNKQSLLYRIINNNNLKRTHCFWIQLVSVLGQNFIHTGLVYVGDKSKPPAQKQNITHKN